MRSLPPEWKSKCLPNAIVASVEHSMCQPGRPSPHGLFQDGSLNSLRDFHRAKSLGLRFSLFSDENKHVLNSLGFLDNQFLSFFCHLLNQIHCRIRLVERKWEPFCWAVESYSRHCPSQLDRRTRLQQGSQWIWLFPECDRWHAELWTVVYNWASPILPRIHSRGV